LVKRRKKLQSSVEDDLEHTPIILGDLVVPNRQLEVVKVTVDKNTFYYDTKVGHEPDIKPPFMINNVFAGIFIGMKYVTQRKRNQTLTIPKYRFAFDTLLVFINPQHVDIISRFDEAKDD
jgi:hypothetical protein